MILGYRMRVTICRIVGPHMDYTSAKKTVMSDLHCLNSVKCHKTFISDKQKALHDRAYHN